MRQKRAKETEEKVMYIYIYICLYMYVSNNTVFLPFSPDGSDKGENDNMGSLTLRFLHDDAFSSTRNRHGSSGGVVWPSDIRIVGTESLADRGNDHRTVTFRTIARSLVVRRTERKRENVTHTLAQHRRLHHTRLHRTAHRRSPSRTCVRDI